MANAYAALRELTHFSSPKTRYQTSFDLKEGSIDDSGPPFRRCVLMQMAGTESAGLQRVINESTGYLFRDLLSPLGRDADRIRAETAAPKSALAMTFGSYRISWPRQALLERAARRSCERLLELWSTRDSSHLSETIRSWLDEQWSRRQFSPDLLLGRLRETCQGELPGEPDAVVNGVVAQFDKEAQQRSKETCRPGN